MSPHLLQTDVCSFKVSDFFREVTDDLCSAGALLWQPDLLLESCYLTSCHSFCNWAVRYTFQNVMSYLMTHFFFFFFLLFFLVRQSLQFFKIALLSKPLYSVLAFLPSLETGILVYSYIKKINSLKSELKNTNSK